MGKEEDAEHLKVQGSHILERAVVMGSSPSTVSCHFVTMSYEQGHTLFKRVTLVMAIHTRSTSSAGDVHTLVSGPTAGMKRCEKKDEDWDGVKCKVRTPA